MSNLAPHIMLNKRVIGTSASPYIIGELSGNHNGSIDMAFKIIDAIADAGADAVKLQTYTADTLTIDCSNDDFMIKGGLWDGRTLYDLYEEAHTPWEWHEELINHARAKGLDIFSSPFDETAVDFLEEFDLPAYKIASFEANDVALINKVAKTGKPIIISTGMANADEIQLSLDTARNAGAENIVLLHCISGYPAPISDANIATITDMQQRYGVPIGLSDHSIGSAVAVGAVALGACVIEKHVTFDRSLGGPDAEFSMEPEEFKAFCDDIRNVSDAIGRVHYDKKSSEEKSLVFRRSLYVVEDINEGDVFTSKNVRSIRPGYGLAPKEYPNILGKKARYDIKLGTALTREMFGD
ncbi:pseudaminic acid synthase [Curvivirga sp.]|uniref:pseudaminic acid synthase n=1 Tax=Curvivirga sp. TaxID=2856848 RepID=UPI003B5A5814